MSVTRAVNRVIRVDLAVSNRSCEERERYEEVPVRMGQPRVEIDNALALATDLEDAEIIRKMSLCPPELSSEIVYQADSSLIGG